VLLPLVVPGHLAVSSLSGRLHDYDNMVYHSPDQTAAPNPPEVLAMAVSNLSDW
jgi:hypothetical protein